MNCTFLDDNKIIIGDNALIAPNVQIYTAFHPTNAKDRMRNVIAQIIALYPNDNLVVAMESGNNVSGRPGAFKK